MEVNEKYNDDVQDEQYKGRLSAWWTTEKFHILEQTPARLGSGTTLEGCGMLFF